MKKHLAKLLHSKITFQCNLIFSYAAIITTHNSVSMMTVPILLVHLLQPKSRGIMVLQLIQITFLQTLLLRPFVIFSHLQFCCHLL
jgi:hypothetical protein